MGWGGRRAGSGAKPKSQRARAVSGVPAHKATVLAHPSVPLSTPLVPVAVPTDLSEDERAVWCDLAPHASARRTLTAGTSFAFRLLCRNVLLERGMMADVEVCGTSNHRGMIQRVDTELLSFGLAPCGKAMSDDGAAVAPANPLERFLARRG